MPVIGSGRVEAGSGNVYFEAPAVGGATPQEVVNRSISVRSVTASNIGSGFGLFAGTNGGQDVTLDFKTLLGGPGIRLINDSDSIVIRLEPGAGGGGGGVGAFTELTDVPSSIDPRGILIGNADGNALEFLPAPTQGNTTLVWTGSGFQWASRNAGSVTSIAATGENGIDVSGSPITSTGTLAFSLTPSGVTPGVYNSVTVDDYGRVTAASVVPPPSFTETDTLQSVMARGNTTTRSLTIGDTTQNTGAGTGALVVDGGAHVGLNMTVGGNQTVEGDLTVLGLINGTIAVAERLAMARTIALQEDVIGSGAFDGSAGVNIGATLAPSGVVAGTYTKLQVDAKGRAIFGDQLTSEDIQPLLGSLSFDNLSISGNLNVGGTFTAATFTSVAANNLTVDNTYILLGGETPPTANDGRDRGVAYRFFDSAQNRAEIGFFGFNNSTGRMTFRTDLAESALAGGIFSTGTLGAIEANITGTAEASSRLSPARPFILSGDLTGQVISDLANGFTLAATLANSGVVPGTYNSVVVDAKGRVTSAAAVIMSGAINIDSADMQGSGATGTFPVAVVLKATGVAAGTYQRVVVDNKGRVTQGFASGSAITGTFTGDATGTGSLPGSIALTLAASGVVAGTYNSVTVDAKGRVTSGSNVAISGNVTLGGDVSGTGTTGSTIAVTLANSGVTAGVYTMPTVTVNAKGLVTSIAGGAVPASTVTLAGAVMGAGSTGGTINTTLAVVPGLVAGTYNRVTVDTTGRVTAASNVTVGTDTLQDVTGRGATTNVPVITMTASTASTSPSTGALVLSGGLGVGGNINTAATSNVNLGIGTGTPIAARLWVTGNSGSTISPATYSATLALNLANSNNWSVTLTGVTTLAAPTGLLPGQSGIIYIQQDATGGRTMTFNSVWRFPNGAAPNLTTTANAVDALVYVVRSPTSISAVLIPNIG